MVVERRSHGERDGEGNIGAQQVDAIDIGPFALRKPLHRQRLTRTHHNPETDALQRPACEQHPVVSGVTAQHSADAHHPGAGDERAHDAEPRPDQSADDGENPDEQCDDRYQHPGLPQANIEGLDYRFKDRRGRQPNRFLDQKRGNQQCFDHPSVGRGLAFIDHELLCSRPVLNVNPFTRLWFRALMSYRNHQEGWCHGIRIQAD